MPKIKPSPLIIGRDYYAQSGFFLGTLVGVTGSICSFQLGPEAEVRSFLNNGSFRMVHTLQDAPVVAYETGA